MNARLLTLSTDGRQIVEECLVDELNLGISQNPKIIALAQDNAITFFKNYQDIVFQGNIPLILNPAIPLDKLKEMSALLGANELLTNDDHIKLENKSHGSVSGQHILCSSGTTSRGVVGKKFVFNIKAAIANGLAHLNSIGIHSPQKILLPMPVTHSFGLVGGLLASVYGGHSLYTLNSGAVNASILLDAIRIHRIDHLYLTPSLLKMMVKFLKRSKSEAPKLSSISIGSSLLFTDDLLQLMSYFPKTKFYFTYGLTEMGPRAFTFAAGTGENPLAFLKENPATPVPIGMPIEGIEYKIENDELLILSPYQSINFASDFFATSDRADLTSVGVRVHGRMDFTIIKSGINIYPAEVEALLTEFSEVIDCALIPQKSESYGQVPVLLLYTTSASEDLITRVTDHLKINLPSAHLPSRIVLRNKDFPRTSMGKIKVNALIEEMENEQS